jgi:CheY-like chemotaxis protein
MPLVDGVEAIKEITRTLPKPIVVAVTGSIEQNAAAAAVAAGAVACVSKTDVRKRLEELLGLTS